MFTKERKKERNRDCGRVREQEERSSFNKCRTCLSSFHVIREKKDFPISYVEEIRTRLVDAGNYNIFVLLLEFHLMVFSQKYVARTSLEN